MAYFCKKAKKSVLKHLAALNKYFWKYRVRLSLGIAFVVLSNFFDILSPQLSGYIINMFSKAIKQHQGIHEVIKFNESGNYNFLVQWFIRWISNNAFTYSNVVILAGVMLLLM